MKLKRYQLRDEAFEFTPTNSPIAPHCKVPVTGNELLPSKVRFTCGDKQYDAVVAFLTVTTSIPHYRSLSSDPPFLIPKAYTFRMGIVAGEDMDKLIHIHIIDKMEVTTGSRHIVATEVTMMSYEFDHIKHVIRDVEMITTKALIT
jgi:hypothetical protein